MQRYPLFEQSYSKFESYPYNLVHRTLYSGTNVAYRRRLDEEQSRLLQRPDSSINVILRELDSCGERKKSNSKSKLVKN